MVAALVLAWQPAYVFACAVTGVQAYQAGDAEVAAAMERASLSQLGAGYPGLPLLEMGYPNQTTVAAPVPCAILKAIGIVEGSWRQAAGSVAVGQSGPVKQSASCGYGIMQITSGMRNPGELAPDVQQQIAADYRYNIGWGAKVLAEKWNAGDALNAVVGNRDPSVGEHWYYAVWAYNQFNFRNNPNNPDFPWPRPAFDGSQSLTNYPYQELVWGYAAKPPLRDGKPLWQAVALTLPDRAAIGDTPKPIAAPASVHAAVCPGFFTDPAAAVFSVPPNSSTAITQKVVVHSGAGPVTAGWTASVSGGAWLGVSPASGPALPSEVTLVVNPTGLAPAVYRGELHLVVQGQADPVVLPVTLEVQSPTRRFFPYLPRRALGIGG